MFTVQTAMRKANLNQEEMRSNYQSICKNLPNLDYKRQTTKLLSTAETLKSYKVLELVVLANDFRENSQNS